MRRLTRSPDLVTLSRADYAGSTYRIYEVIAAAGYLVFAFDQLGMGSRVYETVNVVGQGQDRGTSSAWYDRPSHSEWSQLGKMVHGE